MKRDGGPMMSRRRRLAIGIQHGHPRWLMIVFAIAPVAVVLLFVVLGYLGLMDGHWVRGSALFLLAGWYSSLPRRFFRLSRRGRASLPVRQSTEPVRAWKRASIGLTRDGKADFVGLYLATRYGAEATAACEAMPGRVPHVPGRCGFSGRSSRDDLRAEASLGVATLEVEFHGRVVSQPRGYRAERQRVLRVELDPVCLHCKSRDMRLGIYKEKYLRPICAQHLESDLWREISLSELASMLGTEVCWAAEPPLKGIHRGPFQPKAS